MHFVEQELPLTMPVVLAIVGSVKLAGDREALQIIHDVLEEFRPARVVSGGAFGIDTMAEEAAKAKGIETRIYRPATQTWPDFRKRNLLIAEACTHLIRICARTSSTYGSGWTRDQAKKMGKYTREYVIDV